MEIKSKDELDQIIKLNSKVIVDFWAIWCSPCKLFAPKFESLAKEYPEYVFVKANVGELDELVTSYNISSVPTTIYFKDGIEVKREKISTKEAVVDSIKSIF